MIYNRFKVGMPLGMALWSNYSDTVYMGFFLFFYLFFFYSADSKIDTTFKPRLLDRLSSGMSAVPRTLTSKWDFPQKP